MMSIVDSQRTRFSNFEEYVLENSVQDKTPLVLVFLKTVEFKAG
jgi:hypothetical protein